jgi:SAM-dependent methyltransferase
MPSFLKKQLARLRRKRWSARAVQLKDNEFGDLAAWCATYAAKAGAGMPTQTLDLGCGASPRNPFNADAIFGIDIREDPDRNIKYGDLNIEPIPYPDSSFDYLTAFDFLEHVPRVLYAPARRFPFVELMNEIHRVLKPDGVLLSHTPAYPFAEAFQDPTHVNIVTENTFTKYFDRQHKWAGIYGFTGAFEVVKQGWNRPHLISVLRKVPA